MFKLQYEDAILKLNLSAAVWLALTDHDTVAGVIVSIVLAGGFGVFIIGKVQQRQDLQRKREGRQSG